MISACGLRVIVWTREGKLKSTTLRVVLLLSLLLLPLLSASLRLPSGAACSVKTREGKLSVPRPAEESIVFQRMILLC